MIMVLWLRQGIINFLQLLDAYPAFWHAQYPRRILLSTLMVQADLALATYAITVSLLVATTTHATLQPLRMTTFSVRAQRFRLQVPSAAMSYLFKPSSSITHRSLRLLALVAFIRDAVRRPSILAISSSGEPS